MASRCFNPNIKGVILDISGVLKECGPEGGLAIPGSVDAINRLNESRLQLRFCTNETSVTRKSLVDSLAKLGFAIKEEDVFSPIPAVCKIMSQRKLRPHLLVNPKSLSDFTDSDMEQTDPTCVVIGDATHQFTYENLNSAFRILTKMEHPILFSLGKGRYYQENGDLTLDVGAYMAALEYASGVKAEIVGKPSKSFFNAVLQDMDTSAAETIMVGDDILNDVGGAQQCGMWGVQVRTGKYRPSDETHATVKPDSCVNNLAQFVEKLMASL